MYQKYLEPVIEEFTTGDYYREVYEAKEEYFLKAGKVFEDDSEFESRMNIFMDWYIFERDLPGVDLPPIKYYFNKNQSKFSSEEIGIYKDLCHTHHSLFQLKRKTWFTHALIVKDLFTGKKYTVNSPEMEQGFSKKDIFEARIIPYRGHFEFSQGFCFHPLEMQSFILKEIKKVRYQEKSRHTKLILQLSQMRLNQLRFSHIDVQEIYKHGSKIFIDEQRGT